jgi:hypothetical protein
VSHAISQAHSHIQRIASVFFSFNHEYHTMTNAVAHIISTVQKSGINKNTKYNNALRIMNVSKNCGESMLSFFLVNRLAKNITYASLKNSEG